MCQQHVLFLNACVSASVLLISNENTSLAAIIVNGMSLPRDCASAKYGHGSVNAARARGHSSVRTHGESCFTSAWLTSNQHCSTGNLALLMDVAWVVLGVIIISNWVARSDLEIQIVIWWRTWTTISLIIPAALLALICPTMPSEASLAERSVAKPNPRMWEWLPLQQKISIIVIMVYLYSICPYSAYILMNAAIFLK